MLGLCYMARRRLHFPRSFAPNIVAQALKELFSVMMEDSIHEFAAELRFFSKLQHPHIVPFYGLYRDLGLTDGVEYGRYFLVTKFAVRTRERCALVCVGPTAAVDRLIN